MKLRDVLGAVVFFLFGAVTTILSVQMPIGTLRAAGSGLFPLCLGILLMALSALFIAKVFWAERGQERKNIRTVEERGSSWPVVAFVTVMALTTLLLKPVGYPLASFLLMVGLLTTLGLRRWPLSLALSLLAAVVSYLLFVYLLKIPLPKGLPGI